MSSDSIDDGVAEIDADDSTASWPAAHELASVWEESSHVRQCLRQKGRILLWPNVKTTGVATVENLKDCCPRCLESLGLSFRLGQVASRGLASRRGTWDLWNELWECGHMSL